MFNIDSNIIQIKSRKLLPEIQVKYLCEKVIKIIKINIKAYEKIKKEIDFKNIEIVNS